MASACQDVSDQTGFLSLPRELRDQIYLDVLKSESTQPESPQSAWPREEVIIYGGQRIYYPLHPDTNPFRSLLGCRRQIRTEVQQLYDHLESGHALPLFKLDVLVDGNFSWPTWILCPGRSEHVQDLQVDLRIFHNGYHRSSYDQDATLAIRPLFLLLNQFMFHGSNFLCKGLPTRSTNVEACTVNILPGESDYKIGGLAADEGIINSLFNDSGMLAFHGALSSSIQSIRFRSQPRIGDIQIDERASQDQREHWARHGFYCCIQPESPVIQDNETRPQHLLHKIKKVWLHFYRNRSD